ncbi:MAG: hypothetical protein Q8941_19530 [Bacteroidota bacterium]|nr:hypothetical protein [Bacteroidota bacterium]
MLYPKKEAITCTIVLLSLLLVTACHNYYKATQTPVGSASQKATVMDSLKLQNRYFVLRSGENAYYMNNISLSADQSTLTATLDTLAAGHRLHLTNGRKGKMMYKKNRPEAIVISEVHLYIPEDPSLKPGPYTLGLDKVQKIEVLEKDKAKTTSSYVIGAIGYTLGSMVVVGIIILATKSSCPFVSAYNNDEFSLQGEIYGGSIYPQLARDDYMPLRMSPSANGTLQVKISNELKEKQYTDMADLLIISHDKDTKVLADEKGNLFQVAEPQLPLKATFSNEKDVLAPLQKENDNHLLYFDDTLAENARNYVDIRFTKPAMAAKGKLILSIKNSYWLDYLYGELAKGFGKYYGKYIKKQYKKPASELIKWTREQHMPLEVSIKTSSGWRKLADITTIGPVATREMVVPVDLSGINEPYTEIRLSSGFMFWEIDYAAMDYSPDKNIVVETVSPSIATDESGKNVADVLAKADGIYLEQPVPGNVATLQYQFKPANDPGKSYSYILHTRGYYIHVRDFKNPPDVKFLNQFKKPGTFNGFSLSLYKKFRNTSLQSLAMH